MDNQSRRNNIIVDGLNDERDESMDRSEQKVRHLFKTKLGLDGDGVIIERAHRLGQYRDQGKPRQIIVRLHRFKDRQLILSSASKLKGSNVYINEDFTDAIRKKRKELLPQLRAARERGDMAVLKYDKLIVKPRPLAPPM